MIYRAIISLLFLTIISSASVQKRADEKYGGAGTAPVALPSYSPNQAQPSYAGQPSAPAAPSYSPGTATNDNGNLYYYYYPVQPNTNTGSYYPGNQYPVQPTTSNPLFDIFGFGNIDFNSLIIPLLLLGGVLLLLPAILGCDLQSAVCTIPLPSTFLGKKKREIDGKDGPVTLQENINRAFDLYVTAMEGDMCFKRIACELGGLAGEVKGKGAFFGLLDAVVPDHMRDSMKAFQTGAINEKSTCQVYKCGSKRWMKD